MYIKLNIILFPLNRDKLTVHLTRPVSTFARSGPFEARLDFRTSDSAEHRGIRLCMLKQ